MILLQRILLDYCCPSALLSCYRFFFGAAKTERDLIASLLSFETNSVLFFFKETIFSYKYMSGSSSIVCAASSFQGELEFDMTCNRLLRLRIGGDSGWK